MDRTISEKWLGLDVVDSNYPTSKLLTVHLDLKHLVWTPSVNYIPSKQTGAVARFGDNPSLVITLSHNVAVEGQDGNDVYQLVHKVDLPDRCMAGAQIGLPDLQLKWRVHQDALERHYRDLHLQFSLFKTFTEGDTALQRGRGMECTAMIPLMPMVVAKKINLVLMDMAGVDAANFHAELDQHATRVFQPAEKFALGKISAEPVLVIPGVNLAQLMTPTTEELAESIMHMSVHGPSAFAEKLVDIAGSDRNIQAAAVHADTIVHTYPAGVNDVPHLMPKMRICNTPYYAHLYGRVHAPDDFDMVDSILMPTFAALNKAPDLPPLSNLDAWTHILGRMVGLLRIALHDHNLKEYEFIMVHQILNRPVEHVLPGSMKLISNAQQAAFDALTMLSVSHPYRNDKSHVAPAAMGRSASVSVAVGNASDNDFETPSDQLLSVGAGSMPAGRTTFTDCEDGQLLNMQLWVTILTAYTFWHGSLPLSDRDSALFACWGSLIEKYIPLPARMYCGDSAHGASPATPIDTSNIPHDAKVHGVDQVFRTDCFHRAVLRGIEYSRPLHPEYKSQLDAMEIEHRRGLAEWEREHGSNSVFMNSPNVPKAFVLETTNWYSSSLVPPVAEYGPDYEDCDKRVEHLDQVDEWTRNNQGLVGQLKLMGQTKIFPYSPAANWKEWIETGHEAAMSDPDYNRMYSFYLATMNGTLPIWLKNCHPPDHFCTTVLFGYTGPHGQAQPCHGAYTQQLAMDPENMVIIPVEFIKRSLYFKHLHLLNQLQFPSYIMRRVPTAQEPDAPSLIPHPKNDMLYGPAECGVKRLDKYHCSPMRQSFVQRFLRSNMDERGALLPYYKVLIPEDSLRSDYMEVLGMNMERLVESGSVDGFDYHVYNFDNTQCLYEIRVFIRNPKQQQDSL